MPRSLADARLAAVGSHHQPAVAVCSVAVEGVRRPIGCRSLGDPGRAGSAPDRGALLGCVCQQCLLELRVADADAAAAGNQCGELDRGGLGLVGRDRFVVADVAGDQIGVRYRVDDGADTEGLGFEDAPRCQPFTTHPVAERRFAFEYEHLEAGPRQHRRSGRTCQPPADDDHVERLIHCQPPLRSPRRFLHLGVGRSTRSCKPFCGSPHAG